VTLRAMEVFLQVVETGSMRGAAERLYISQPSVSGVIADLEREYGVRLFERLGKKLYITAQGQALAGYARRMLALHEEMDRRMSGLGDDTPLRIGASVTVGACVLGGILAKLDGPPPRVICNNTRIIEQLLLLSRLDAALVEGRIVSPDLLVTPVIRDTLMLICRADSEFAGRESVPLEEIARQPLLMRERGSGTRATLDNLFEARGLRLEPQWECNNTQALLGAVAQGFGVALLSPRLLRPQDGLAAVPVSGCDLGRWFSLVVHKDKYISARLTAFCDLCAGWE
jgi:DNA-binding transcriptional LysR family regulator